MLPEKTWGVTYDYYKSVIMIYEMYENIALYDIFKGYLEIEYRILS